ncbi:sorbitol utilization protein SOU2 [Cordyceps fumosorosea ARSEF 2679]|uniref:Sorbitol utilization protein SOU2 n=1 Tax=Cordyceps fumosorosea (strain ARSEF 2679) TaxID=1081104 RepID=A0A162M1J7_CORFA|nr:sorbitol utilization protein SOU2 [Cordyceps fumosorosea ARSEF 2679]OAA48810.1 sorbitol utilization protein SOU2 [Cordyceps fumosorosea ARSEF 2679]
MAGPMENGVFRRNNTLPPAAGPVMPLFSLSGKTAIISGAGQGIGLAVAEAFAEAGANVALWYNRNDAAVTEAERIAAAYGVTCEAYKVDVASLEQVQAGVLAAMQDLNGRLDVFVANAGVSWGDEAFIDADVERYRALTRTNTDGVAHCAHVAGQHFRRQRREGTALGGAPLEGGFAGGSFIATASMSGHIVNVPRRQAAYNASKAAVVHLCKSLAIEWLGFARVNSVSPGFFKTGISGPIAEETMSAILDRVPMGRFGETLELKAVYLFLASSASSYVTGTDILVDGGYTAT